MLLTLDYGVPFCHDPVLFGAISAANALSDIFAMGGRPVAALSILGSPGTISERLLLAISEGAAETCDSAGAPIVGGHSAEGLELIYGLSVIGMCRPHHIVRNCTARPADKIILSKPLGFGVYAQAAALGVAEATTVREAWRIGRQVNSVGATLAERRLVSAMTDVTGFGLLGHLLEMAQGSGLRARVRSASVPFLPACETFLLNGLSSAAGLRNQTTVRRVTMYDRAVPRWLRHLMSEPETNGGLLLSVETVHVDDVLQTLLEGGFENSSVVGEFLVGPVGVEVT